MLSLRSASKLKENKLTSFLENALNLTQEFFMTILTIQFNRIKAIYLKANYDKISRTVNFFSISSFEVNIIIE